MIVKMSKYDLVLFYEQKDDFLNKLQDLGLMDITISGWEPDEEQRKLMLSIEKHRGAVTRLEKLSKEDGFPEAKPYANGEEAFDEYLRVSSEYDSAATHIAQFEKEAEDLKPWGEFNIRTITELEDKGVALRYFTCHSKEFQSSLSDWSENYNIFTVNDEDNTTYFVVISSPGEEILINAQEVKAPQATYKEKLREAEELEKKREKLLPELARAATSIEMIKSDAGTLEEKLEFSKVAGAGKSEAEGTLIIMQGWATKETSEKVDEMLAAYPNLFYIKSDPTPEDDTPTVLKNRKYSSLFEIIGDIYALPKYGTMDLTRFFAPFYMLFFGLCLGDAGYGLLLFLAGLFMARKTTKLKNVGKLAMWLGGTTVVCGLLMGSIFGIDYTDFKPFADLKEYLLDSNKMFPIAIGLGVIQVFLGMSLKVYKKTVMYGFKHALSTIGWMLLIITIGLWLGGPKVDIHVPSYIAYASISVALFLMFFMNSPGKNPFFNFGLGIWNTYNDVIGFISDVLSYIRLFAIGLSGGVLAMVFNQLALGLSPDIPVLRQLSIIIILLIGHGINLFMSTISAFVHPMRLTFVEFYNNADFEATERKFTPFRRLKQD